MLDLKIAYPLSSIDQLYYIVIQITTHHYDNDTRKVFDRPLEA
jgi:hypothetical protein